MTVIRSTDRILDFNCGCAARLMQRFAGRKPDAWTLANCELHTELELEEAVHQNKSRLKFSRCEGE